MNLDCICPVCRGPTRIHGRIVPGTDGNATDAVSCGKCHQEWISSPPVGDARVVADVTESDGGTLRLPWLRDLLPAAVFSANRLRVLDVARWDCALLSGMPAHWVRHGGELHQFAANVARGRGLTVCETDIRIREASVMTGS